MKYVKLLLCVLLLALPTIGTSKTANRTDTGFTLDITEQMLSSAQSCPTKHSVQLSCSTYHQTTNYTCGPAVVMTLMRYYGKLNGSQMNRSTELQISNQMDAVKGEGGGTTLEQMTSWLSSHGFSVSSGKNISTDMLIENIRKGIPTIITFNNHWILAKGYNEANPRIGANQDEIIFSDSCAGSTIITRDEIDSTWQESHMANSHCNSNGDYIIATPH